jgi:hypothetical protein
MEIIGRFPAVALEKPGGETPDATDHPAHPVEKVPRPRPGWRLTGRAGSKPPVAFPVRSVAALAVLATVVWVVTLRNEAAQRRAANGARAATIAADSRESIAK